MASPFRFRFRFRSRLTLATALAFALAPAIASAQPAVSAPSRDLAKGAQAAAPLNPQWTGPTVNEDEPSPISTSTRSFAGWADLWSEVGKGSIDLRIALAEIERAEAATRIAYGGVLPTAIGQVVYTHIPPSGEGTAFSRPAGNFLSSQLTVAATLINLRGFHAIGTAKVGEEIARLSLADVRRRLGLNLSRAVVGITSALRLAELNRIGVSTSLERLVLTRKRLAAGVGDNRDLVRAQQDVAVARATLAPADEALRQAREGLAIVLGTSGELDVGSDSEGLQRDLIAFCGAGSVATMRVDEVIAQKQIELAKRNVDDIALKFVPTLTAQLNVSSLGSLTNVDSPAGSPPPSNFAPGWSVQGILTIPFYDGGVRYGERRDRRALVEEARARAVQVAVSIVVERSQARRAIDVALSAQSSAKEARDLAKEADRLARVAYAAGVGTNFDLIDAGRRLREAEDQLVLRDLDLARAKISLPFVEGKCAGV
ncbi:MAG: hypothetical protein NVSMB1_19730 [Polyangiales bacterium]